jgi:hypothetical protein
VGRRADVPQWNNVRTSFRENRSTFQKLCVEHMRAHAHSERKHDDMQVLFLTRRGECRAGSRLAVTLGVYVCV